VGLIVCDSVGVRSLWWKCVRVAGQIPYIKDRFSGVWRKCEGPVPGYRCHHGGAS